MQVQVQVSGNEDGKGAGDGMDVAVKVGRKRRFALKFGDTCARNVQCLQTMPWVPAAHTGTPGSRANKSKGSQTDTAWTEGSQTDTACTEGTQRLRLHRKP